MVKGDINSFLRINTYNNLLYYMSDHKLFIEPLTH